MHIDEQSMNLYIDNQAAIHMTKHRVLSSRTKHIDTRFHFIREHIDNGTITPLYIKTEDNVSDVLTKALPRVRFTELALKSLGMMRKDGSIVQPIRIKWNNYWLSIKSQGSDQVFTRVLGTRDSC